MNQRFMPLPHCAAFGWAYGRLAALAPELATPGRYSNALQLPLIGFGALNRDVSARTGISRELANEIGQALAGIDHENLQANAYGQSAFALWYYKGLAGEPFPARLINENRNPARIDGGHGV